jgi:hypothetical protein
MSTRRFSIHQCRIHIVACPCGIRPRGVHVIAFCDVGAQQSAAETSYSLTSVLPRLCLRDDISSSLHCVSVMADKSRAPAWPLTVDILDTTQSSTQYTLHPPTRACVIQYFDKYLPRYTTQLQSRFVCFGTVSGIHEGSPTFFRPCLPASPIHESRVAY